LRFLTEIHSQNLSITTKIIPESNEEAKELIGIEGEIWEYIIPYTPERLLAIIKEGVDRNVWYVVFNLKQLDNEEDICSAEYFVDAMKFSQKLFRWLSFRKFPGKFPKGWELVIR